ncbi:hypothetical protein [Streptomyces sp.]|uniref:hypothetical protein n=1 Tax=Streptomyces sp. TaxID=1931 RepID=UPI0028118D12|nr:hypothetical protein [Streptomyces sp.]
MTAPDSLPLHALAEENLASASPDLLRAMVKTSALQRASASADMSASATSSVSPPAEWRSSPSPWG